MKVTFGGGGRSFFRSVLFLLCCMGRCVGGMLLIANTRLPEDALCQLRFTLPESDGHSIEVGAHVLWSDDASAPGQSWAGLRFLGLAPQVTRSLREWVGRSGSDAR